jgi:hypothetical protein
MRSDPDVLPTPLSLAGAVHPRHIEFPIPPFPIPEIFDPAFRPPADEGFAHAVTFNVCARNEWRDGYGIPKL